MYFFKVALTGFAHGFSGVKGETEEWRMIPRFLIRAPEDSGFRVPGEKLALGC